MADLKNAIAVILNTAQIAAVIDTTNGTPNIFSGTVPEIAGYSRYIVFRRISGVEDVVLDGDTGLMSSRVQVDCIAPTEDQAIAIKAAVLSAPASGGIQGYNGTPIGTGVTIRSCFQAGQHDFDQPSPTNINLQTFGRSIDFLIWHFLAGGRSPT